MLNCLFRKVISILYFVLICVNLTSTHLGGVIQLENLDTHFKFNLTDQLPVIPVKYIAFAGYRRSRTKVKFDCVDMETTIDTTEASTETVSTTEYSTEKITTETPNEALKDSIVDYEINDIIPKSTTETSIELTTVVTSSLL